MTAPEIPVPAENAPAPPRPFGLLARRLRHWLGIDDQRQDFDRFVSTLHVKDQRTESILNGLIRSQGKAVEQLNRTTTGYVSLEDRLSFHERGALIKSKQRYDAAVTKEVKRRDALIAAHPELTEQERGYVRAMGKLPDPPAENGAHPVDAPT